MACGTRRHRPASPEAPRRVLRGTCVFSASAAARDGLLLRGRRRKGAASGPSTAANGAGLPGAPRLSCRCQFGPARPPARPREGRPPLPGPSRGALETLPPGPTAPIPAASSLSSAQGGQPSRPVPRSPPALGRLVGEGAAPWQPKSRPAASLPPSSRPQGPMLRPELPPRRASQPGGASLERAFDGWGALVLPASPRARLPGPRSSRQAPPRLPLQGASGTPAGWPGKFGQPRLRRPLSGPSGAEEAGGREIHRQACRAGPALPRGAEGTRGCRSDGWPPTSRPPAVAGSPLAVSCREEGQARCAAWPRAFRGGGGEGNPHPAAAVGFFLGGGGDAKLPQDLEPFPLQGFLAQKPPRHCWPVAPRHTQKGCPAGAPRGGEGRMLQPPMGGGSSPVDPGTVLSLTHTHTPASHHGCYQGRGGPSGAPGAG